MLQENNERKTDGEDHPENGAVRKKEKNSCHPQQMFLSLWVQDAKQHHQQKPKAIAAADDIVFIKRIVPEREKDFLQ